MSLDMYDVVDRTDTGLVRVHNEDHLAVHAGQGLVVVADGMGGAAAGEIASQLAAETITAHILAFDPGQGSHADNEERRLVAAFKAANRLIWDRSIRMPEYRGMGTTAVAGLFGNNFLTFAHIGDSRLYRYRGKRLECLTTDHSVLQESVDDGLYPDVESAMEAGVAANMLTRVLGVDTDVDVDVGQADLKPGDLYLFCSDGLYNMIPFGEIQAELKNNETDLDELADVLIEKACINGGEDNITLVLVRRRG